MLSLSWALSATLTRNNRNRRALSAVTAPKLKAQNGHFRRFSPIFADFDKKAQKSNQNKAGIGTAHQFYFEKGISGVIPEIFFIYWTPLIEEIPWFSKIFDFERHFWSV